MDKAILSENADKNFRPKAPGMKYKHYAPKGDLTIVGGERRSRWSERINASCAPGRRRSISLWLSSQPGKARENTAAEHVFAIGSQEG